jgi:nucleoside-diphosphate-sugar epimerase
MRTNLGEKMNIFITGTTGFIGSNLAMNLAESGHIIHALYRTSEKTSIIQHKNIKTFKGDILDKKSLRDAMKSCSQVYHLGAFARVWAKNPETYFRVNVEGTKNVIETAIDLGVKKMVITSTAGVLGPSNGKPQAENSIRYSDFCNEYESSKFMMENLIHEYRKQDIQIMLVNPSRVYGPGLLSAPNATTKIIKLYLSGKWHIIPGNGQRIGNYVFIDDVVNGHILAMEKGQSGDKFNLGGINASYSDFFSLLAEVSGKKKRLLKVPVPLMVHFSGLLYGISRIFGESPLITPKWVKKYLHDWAVSSEKAQKKLGYSITPLNIGMEKTIEWLKEGC